MVEELFEDIQSGKMIILIGKPATGKSVMVRYIGFKSIKQLENEVFYIDFINTDQRDKEIFLENMVNIIKHPTFETLKIDEQSPIFILENIHDPELRRLKIGRKSLIKSLKALEGKVKLIMTTREDITEISDLNWIERDIIIDLNQKPDLNKEIVYGMLEKVKTRPFDDFFKAFNWEKKDKIENLWLFGWFLRVLTNAGDITSTTGDGFKRYLRKAIKEYYNMRNFPGNNQFLPEQILIVLLILSTLSKYETNMEKQFIIDYGMHYFDHLTKQDLENILQLLLQNKEISISSGQLTVRFEYRIPHIKLAEILLDYYADEEIIRSLEKILDNYIEFGKNISHLGYNLGMAGDHKKAILCFKKEMESNPKNANNLESLGLAHAYILQYDEAIEAFKKAVEIETNRVHSWYCLGLSYNKKSYYDEAIEAFKKAIKIDSNHFYAWDNLGLAHSGKAQYDKAIEAHKKAINIKSNHNNAWLNLGTANSGKGQYDEAIEAFKKAISIDQNDDDAWYNLGLAYDGKEQYDEAIEAFKKAIEIKPNKIYAWDNLGVIYIKNKQYDKAIEAFEKAIDIDPKEGGIWYNIACAQSRKNNKKRALQCLKKAIGFNKEKYISLARNDEDFDNIRDSEDFRKLLDSS
ncbi:hypothetical protein LCGC14_1352950 [marine sediment metagenome]|uniref:Uncharacterized protein n=1 Tax=marine sediment metagenome TaxID=412755 RepID=A0A0F9KAY2_9ZZZZ